MSQKKHYNIGRKNPNWGSKSFTPSTIQKFKKLSCKENHSRWKKIPKKIIEGLYLNQKRSIAEIAKILKCSTTAIYNKLLYYKIKRRTQSEAMKEKFLGRKLSKEHKEKISKSRIKKKSARGKHNPMFGKKHSTKTRSKMSIIAGGSGIPYEDKQYTYYFYSIRDKIRKGDKNICQLCKKIKLKNGNNLDVHHIDYNKNNNKFINLISLCKKCHLKTNRNRELWKEVFLPCRNTIIL